MSRIELGTTVNRTAITAAALLLLAGCAGEQPSSRASVEIRGTSPSATASATTARRSGKGGVVAYDGYEAAVAHDGDTVSSVADRIGLSASELGAYNGLAPDHPLRDGDELVLPPRPGGYGATSVVPAPTEAYTPTYNAPPPVGTAPGTEVATIETAPLEGTAGTAFPSAAPTGQDSAAASWSPDLAAAAINRAASPIDNSQPGGQPSGQLGAPPSSGEPLPPAPQRPRSRPSPRRPSRPSRGAPRRKWPRPRPTRRPSSR